MRFRAINHMAMITNDMENTVRFYRDILGMPLVATLGNRPDGYPTRHYFFEMGPSSCIAFFEWPGFDNGFYKPAGQPFRGPLQFDHLSFDLETEEELLELQDRLEKAGVGVTTVIDHRVIHSIYFHDNNGIALEASVWITDPTGHAPDYSDPIVFQDPDPVPALREEMERARLIETS